MQPTRDLFQVGLLRADCGRASWQIYTRDKVVVAQKWNDLKVQLSNANMI